MTQSRPWLALTALLLALAGGLAVAGAPAPPEHPGCRRCPISGVPACSTTAPCPVQTAASPEVLPCPQEVEEVAASPEILPYPEEEQDHGAGDAPSCKDPFADGPCCSKAKECCQAGSGCCGKKTACSASALEECCPEATCPAAAGPAATCPAVQSCPVKSSCCQGESCCEGGCQCCCATGAGCCKDKAASSVKRRGKREAVLVGPARPWVPVPGLIPPGPPVPNFMVIMAPPFGVPGMPFDVPPPPAGPCPLMNMLGLPPMAVPPMAVPPPPPTIRQHDPLLATTGAPMPAVPFEGYGYAQPTAYVATPAATVPTAPQVNLWRIACADEDGEHRLNVQMSHPGEPTTLICQEMSLKVGEETLKVAVKDGHVLVAGSFFKARAGTVSRTGTDGLVLEGDVQVKYERDGHKASVTGERVLLGLTDGRLEVNPASARPATTLR